jgi:hypothetical protein
MPYARILLYIPDLISARFPADQGRIRLLEKLFSRADATPATNEIAVLEGYFGLHPGGLAVAALERLADTGLQDSACWWRADPAHLVPDRDQLVMLPQASLAITLREMQQIAETINNHYGTEGIALETQRPERGYLRVPIEWQCRTWDPGRIAGCAVAEFMPTGRDENALRKFMTEIQMLLHTHPVNQAREASGQSAINSLWLWGGGRLPGRVTQSPARIITSLPLVRGLAKLAGQSDEAWPVDLEAHTGEGQWLIALSMNDFGGDVFRLQRELAAPLWRALAHGRVQGIQFYPGGEHIYALARHAARRFWRRTRPIWEFLHEPTDPPAD